MVRNSLLRFQGDFCMCLSPSDSSAPGTLHVWLPVSDIALWGIPVRLLLWADFPVYLYFYWVFINILILIETILEKAS